MASTADGAALTPSEYITHHLGHLSNGYQTAQVDFSIIHFDTVFWSLAMGMLGCFVMYKAARHATSGTPGRFQALVEIIVEMVEDQSKSIVHGNRSFIAPVALTVFIWVFLMNALDLLPIDMMGALLAVLGIEHIIAYHRIVPTADLNGTLGMALGVLAVVFYYNIKIKGFGGWMHEWFAAPFGPWMFPFNILLNAIEYVARTVSLAMRLWGNMYAGELIFMLIALLGSMATVFGFIGHVIAGSIWAIFHILIILLQAFIFMMLTLVYIGQAHEAH